MNQIENVRMLTTTQTVYALGDFFSGPWLLPRTVELSLMNGDPTAKGSMEISENNFFMAMHRHGFPGVVTAEFTQQLGFLISLEILEIKDPPYMTGLKVKARKDVQIGDIVTATVTLKEIKRRSFFFFEASVVNQHNDLVMQTWFQGTPAMKSESTQLAPTEEQIQKGFAALAKNNLPAIREACRRLNSLGCS